MSIASGKKKLCSTCQKTAGILTCRGCGKEFCYRHVVEHRQELNKLMDEVATNHDQLQQTIVEQEAQPNSHPVMKKIDEYGNNNP
jgi:flavoprotein